MLVAAPIGSFLFVQVLKRVIGRLRGEPTRRLTNTYGGMPSSHAAFVSTLTTLVGLEEGVDSTAFAIAAVFSLIILTDAIFFRRHLERFGQTLERLVSRIPEAERTGFPAIAPRLGHTVGEVIVGIIVGIIVGLLVARF